MGIIIAILIFSLIVTVHEFGHFICAKLSGINVLEFSVGMGPKLLQKQYHGTKYSLRVIPMGGYCAMEDEDASSDNPHGFRNAKLWKRMIVLVAGPLMNFVLGFILIVGMVLSMKTIPTTTVKGFFGSKSDDGKITYYSQSHETGLEHDDRIISVDGTSIFSYLDLSYIFATTKTHTHDVVVERDGKRVELPEVVFNDKRDGDMVDFAFEAGSDIVQIGPMMIEGRAKFHPELWLSFQEIQEVEWQVEQLAVVYGDRIRPRYEFYCECRSDKVLPADVPKDIKLGSCTAAEEFIIIGPDGRRRKCMHTWEVLL